MGVCHRVDKGSHMTSVGSPKNKMLGREQGAAGKAEEWSERDEETQKSVVAGG